MRGLLAGGLIADITRSDTIANKHSEGAKPKIAEPCASNRETEMEIEWPARWTPMDIDSS